MPTEIRTKVPPAPRPPARPTERPVIPPYVVAAAGVLMLFTIVVAGIARYTGSYHVTMPPASPVATRDLLFADQRDGGVLVTDAKTGAHVATVEPKTGGFLRGIMRGLVREHRLNDLAAGAPFRLTRWSDGRLSIADPATKESFDLEAFGATNEAAFAAFLDGPAEAARAQAPAGEGAR